MPKAWTYHARARARSETWYTTVRNPRNVAGFMGSLRGEGSLRERGGAQYEAVLVLLEPALQVERPARDQHAVAELRAHAVEGAIERRAAARLALGEQVALLAAAAHEVRERHAQGMQRHAPRELAPQQLERQQQHHRVGVRRHAQRARRLRALAVAGAQPHRDRARA